MLPTRGTKHIPNALQLHPFLSMHAEIKVPREPSVAKLIMKRIIAVYSEMSTCEAWQQTSAFCSTSSVPAALLFCGINLSGWLSPILFFVDFVKFNNESN